jgi:hypothetical protein
LGAESARAPIFYRVQGDPHGGNGAIDAGIFFTFQTASAALKKTLINDH